MKEFTYSPVTKQSHSPRISRKYCVFLCIFILIALCMLITGIVLLVEQAGGDRKKDTSEKGIYMSEYCEPSEEAKRIKLHEFLEKCQVLYFKLKPSAELYFRQDSSAHELDKIARKFTPYMPTPEFLKHFTDQVLALKEELKGLTAEKGKLKPKESQSLAEIDVFLDTFMSSKYDLDFYGGDWMFGPNYFCMNLICYLDFYIKRFLNNLQLKTEEDIYFVINTLQAYEKTFNQYMKNMQLGIRTGMVKSKSSCKAGADAIKEHHSDIINKKDGGADNILPKEFTTAHLPTNIASAWESEHNETVRKSLVHAWMSGFVTPLLGLINYLDEIHIRHCPPDDVASGLSTLPLHYVYLDGTPDNNNLTTKTLPITNGKLDGKELYKRIVPRFTTTDISPEMIFAEGEKQLNIFYTEMINATKIYTNETDENIAIKKMKEIMEDKTQWHGEATFPKNESDENAFKSCKNDTEAEKHCPVRWKSSQIWINYMYGLMGMIHPKLNKAFYFTGNKVSTPSCPVKMINHYNPSNGAMYFDNSDAQCTRPAYFALPFFLEKYGPKFQEWSLNGHEARPGHHFQLQGMLEKFPHPCSKGLSSFFHSLSYFTSFVEGWALYGENPVLSHDIDLYQNNLLQKIGMYKWQVWRAVRLVVDTGLHYRDKNRTWALQMFEKYTWDKTDFARKEVTRYMSCPGQATSYMIGRLTILKARQKVELELGNLFDLKEFHYQVLSLGQTPLGYLLEHIDRYISCKKDPTLKYCEYVLLPLPSILSKSPGTEEVLRPQLGFPGHRHYV